MDQITKRYIITFSTLIVLVLVTGNNLKAQDKYTAVCNDLIDNKFMSQCSTSIYNDSDEAFIYCSLIVDCGCGYGVDCQSNPMCIQPPFITYRCKPIADNRGQIIWSCKGWVGTFMDSRDDKSFTEDEFNDLSTRCTWRCGTCRSGWK